MVYAMFKNCLGNCLYNIFFIPKSPTVTKKIDTKVLNHELGGCKETLSSFFFYLLN